MPKEVAPTGRRTFAIERCIGRGSFGEVYLARMRSEGGLDTEVALKVLRADLDADSDAGRRMLDEARLLGLLNHPAILLLHDVVELEGRVALVTEYVPGADLGRQPEPLPPRPALEVLARVADALEAAWNSPFGEGGRPLRLVHRDVKPSNIRVGPHGQVKLLDFGVAKAAIHRSVHTAAELVVGSFEYMPPERLRGDDATTRGDVYALGCVLFELLAHAPLHRAGNVRKQVALATDRASHDAALRARLAELDPAEPVRSLLERMLAFEPAERPDVVGLAAELEELAVDAGGPPLARWARTVRWDAPAEVEGALTGVVAGDSCATSTTLAAPLGRPRARRRQVALAGLVVAVAVAAIVTNGASEPTVPRRAPERPPLERLAPASPTVAAPVRQLEPVATPEPAPAPHGRVEVHGDAVEVWLVAGGVRVAPGQVPPGVYQVEAVFADIGRVDAGAVRIERDRSVVLTCRSGFYRCVEQP